MANRPSTPSECNNEALLWTAQLHRTQTRQGKPVPNLSHLIAERFGDQLAAIAVGGTDAAEGLTGAGKEPWLVRKTRTMASREHKSETSLLVTAADSALNAREMELDGRKDSSSWTRFDAGLEGTAWHLRTIHRILSRSLPLSRSNGLLGDAVHEIHARGAYRQLVPAGTTPDPWAEGVLQRPETQRRGSQGNVSPWSER